ncbi:MAG: SPOR domain-containing protein [Epsilonproteobacteria bacterium]|nr:SPOR domain-containing protein [Campylobacterota bacterium]
MKYKNKIVLSSILLTLLNTGCVKPTEEVNTAKNNDATVVYEDQPNGVVYEETTPIVYDPTTTTTTAGNTVIYGTPTGDGTIVATDHYQPAVGSTMTTGGGAYSSNIPSGGEIYNGIDDPYVTTTNNNPYTTTTNSYSNNTGYNSSYNGGYTTNNTSYTVANTAYSGSGGVQLQVAALRDYYAAEEFKNSLSLPSKYKAYVKRGPINKVIITGFSSRAEAKALAARQFPDAFIVKGSSSSVPSSYSGSSSYSTPLYSSGSSYTTNTSYSTNTNYSTSSKNINSTIGVQVGAFSSKVKARSIAQQKAGGRYTALVKTAKVRGKTIYKAIITGFSSRAEAKNAIASGQFGDAFVVTLH